MDSTMRSNATVGPPIELLFMHRDALGKRVLYRQFEQDDEYLIGLREAWNAAIVDAFNNLPALSKVFGQG